MTNRNQQPISLDALTAAERQSLETFLRESYALFLVAEANISFKSWLDILSSGIHEAFTARTNKNNNI